MPVPERLDHPLMDHIDDLLELLRQNEAQWRFLITSLQQRVEIASEKMNPEQLHNWGAYLYWVRPPRIELSWLAMAMVGKRCHQSLKGVFAPITTGIRCTVCGTPIEVGTRTELYAQQVAQERGQAVFCGGCRPEGGPVEK